MSHKKYLKYKEKYLNLVRGGSKKPNLWASAFSGMYDDKETPARLTPSAAPQPTVAPQPASQSASRPAPRRQGTDRNLFASAFGNLYDDKQTPASRPTPTLPPDALVPLALEEVSPGHNGCCSGATKIVKAHGVLTTSQFSLQEGYQLITMTEVSESPIVYPELETEIYEFYMAGNFLFEDQDRSSRLSAGGQVLLAKAQEKVGNYEFRNHIGGLYPITHEKRGQQVMCNDMDLQFRDPTDSHVDCIRLERSQEENRIKFPYNTEGRKIQEIRLSQLLELYGPGTYIVVACRDLPAGVQSRSRVIEIIRDTSNDANLRRDHSIDRVRRETEEGKPGGEAN